jgi:hypothetical protein
LFAEETETDMDVIKTLPAGAPGTKRYRQQYGEKLLFVRYRADPATQRRVTTIELVVESAPLRPPRHAADKVIFPRANQRLLIRVSYREEALRQRVKAAGGRWVPEERLWQLPYRQVKALNLEERVVKPAT